MDLLGLSASKRSMHASVDLDSEFEQVMSQLVQAPALAVLTGKTEAPDKCG
jgi:hypothetical protein